MDKILTPLYRFIIYLEEFGTVNSSAIDFIDKKSLRGVVGKMEAMGLINNKESTISLSDSGYQFLNSILDAIHKPTLHWDGKWRVIYFSTPEKIRAQRDKFRRDVEGCGFRPIIKGLWFSPIYGKAVFDKLVKLNGMDGMALFFEAQNIEGIGLDKVARAWDFDLHRRDYEGFITESQQFLSSKQKNRLRAKELIFVFAMILNNEPQLPIELLPSDWPKYRAKLMYKRLRNSISV